MQTSCSELCRSGLYSDGLFVTLKYLVCFKIFYRSWRVPHQEWHMRNLFIPIFTVQPSNFILRITFAIWMLCRHFKMQLYLTSANQKFIRKFIREVNQCVLNNFLQSFILTNTFWGKFRFLW